LAARAISWLRRVAAPRDFKPSCSEAQKSAGYALVLVLLGVALLSLMVESALLVATRSVDTAAAEAIRLRLDGATQAGITEGILALVDRRPAARWPVDGTPRDIAFDGVQVRVAISSELGKIDLNNDARPLIFGLFSAAGLDATDADTFADRVLDWREPGAARRLNGAKAADYRAAGLPYGPRGGPFQSIDELNLVLGMTPDLSARLAPAITVYSVLPAPQPQTAPPLVLRAIGMDSASIEAVMAARAKGEVAPSGPQIGPDGQSPIPGLPTTVFTITAAARLRGVLVVHSETIRFTGNPQRPFWVLAWR